MRVWLKQGIWGTMRATGAFAASTALRRRHSLVILCYHGISLRDEHEWGGGLYLPPTAFRERLQFLRDWGANVLPLAEGIRRLQEDTLPPRSVVITFDDGFVDFHRHALPALQEFSFPATLYLTTWYSQYRLPVFNLMVNYLRWKSGDPEYMSRQAREKASLEMERQAKQDGLDPHQRDDLARALAVKAGIDYDDLLRNRMFQIMSPEEARECYQAGTDLQLHTHRHRTPVDRELFLREIQDNSAAIEAITGTRPLHFCYPSGVTDSAFLPWLREAGVQSATTCVHGLARRGSDPLLLPRYLDGTGTSELDFEAWLSGVR